MANALRQITFAIAAVAGLALSGASAPATELVLRDVHLGLEYLPGDFSYDVKDANGKRSGDDSFDSFYGIAAGATYSFSGPGDSRGFLLGAEITAAQAAYQSIGHLSNYGLRVEGGYGWALSDRWAVAGKLQAGYGLATLDITTNSAFTALSSSGTFFSYGAAVELDVTLTDSVLLNLEAGYLSTTDKLSGSGIDTTLDNKGFRAAIGITYRYSTRPRPLE